MVRGESHLNLELQKLQSVPKVEQSAEARAVTADNREPTDEVPKAESGEARAAEPLLFEQLPEEIQVKLLDQVLAGMREAIGPVKDYAVFASTAMYLNGEKIVAQGDEGGHELMKPPGDFDAAVFQLRDLDEIRNRMRRMPDVIFSNFEPDENGKPQRDTSGQIMYEGKPGEYVKLEGDTKVLRGKKLYTFEIDGKPQQVAYDFEFFLNSRMVRPEVAKRSSDESHGLKILNLDGLQDQYARNIQFELRLNESVQKLVADLRKPEAQDFKAEIMAFDPKAAAVLSESTQQALERFEVTANDMKRVFEIQAELDNLEASSPVPFAKLSHEGLFDRYIEAQKALGNEDKVEELTTTYKHVQDLIAERATLLAGTKTKIAKRDLNLIQLARLRNQSK